MRTINILSALVSTLLLTSHTVAQRKGGGGGGDGGGSGGDSDGGFSGGGENAPPCTRQFSSPPESNSLMRPFTKASTFAEDRGSFFEGEATFTYSLFSPDRQLRNCRDNATQSLNWLGLAWIGAKEPLPPGGRNTFLFIFKAWQSSVGIENFGWSYNYCENVERMDTSSSFRGRKGREDEKGYTTDVVEMVLVPQPDNIHQLDFNGTYIGDYPTRWPENLDESNNSITVPNLCSQVTGAGGRIEEGTVINGTMTNSTLSFSMAGVIRSDIAELDTYTRRINTVLNWKLDFTGKFASENSTEVLQINGTDANVLSWKENVSSRSTVPGWTSLLIFVLVVVACS